jgi:hypothetical protein
MFYRHRQLLAVFVVLAAGPTLSACSVGMAVSGQESPNLAVCRVGADRADVQAQLGMPISERILDNGDSVCTYEYEVGNEPSVDRAVTHGAMDVFTLGLWELVGTPMEAVQGEKFEMTVTYGPDGKAKAIESRPAS